MKNKRKKGVNGFCKRNYSEIWNYIKECKNFIWVVVGVFLLGIVMSGFFPVPVELREFMDKMIRELILKTEGLGTFELVWFIFKNNIFVCFIFLFSGILLGIIPLIYGFLNGYVVGYVAKLVVLEFSWVELWRLVPHGIFELPAVFLAMGLGVRWGLAVFAKDPGKEFIRRLILGVKTFVFVVFPLLVVAAVIEGALMGLGI